MANAFIVGLVVLLTLQVTSNGNLFYETTINDMTSNNNNTELVLAESTESSVLTHGISNNKSTVSETGTPNQGRSQSSRYGDGLLSEEQFTTAKRYMMLFFFPIIISFGILGNLLSIICLLRLPSQDSVTVYLCALAMADTVALVCYFISWLPVLLTETDEAAAEFVEAHTFIPVKNFLKLAAKHTSTYLVIVVSVERLLAVCKPLMMRQNAIVRYPKIIAGCIVILVSSFFLVNMWRYEIHTFLDTDTNFTRYEVTRSKAAREGEILNLYGLLAQIIFTFIPTCIVLVSTIVIIIVLFKQNKLRQKLTGQQGMDPQNEIRRVTWMLVAIAIIYTTSALPTCIIGIISKFSKDIKLFSKEHHLVYLMYTIGDFLSAIKASVNFLVYVVFSSRFRVDFLLLITCSKRARSSKAVTMSYRMSEYTKD